MATINHTATFDGVNDASRDPVRGAIEWFDGFMGYYSIYNSDAADFLDSSVSLTGDDWTVATMRFGGAGGNKVTITDTTTGDARIDYLSLGENSDVTLVNTQVRYIFGHDGEHDVTLGNEHTYGVNLYGEMNRITTGSGFVSHAQLDGRIAAAKIEGIVGRLDVRGDEKARVNVEAGGDIQNLRLRGDDTKLTVKQDGDVATVNLYGPDSGSQVIDIKDGGEIRVITSNGGDLDIMSAGNGRVRTVEFFEGSLTMEVADRSTATMLTYNAALDLTIGSGGVGSIQYGSEEGLSHTIVANGGIGTLRGFNDLNDAMNLTLGDGGAIAILTNNGNDTIKTGAGDVEIIRTRDGNDKVTAGSGVVEDIYTGGGKDVVKLTGDWGGNVRLGAGNDKFIGGSGNDLVIGGAGNDNMNGKGGEDSFMFFEGSGNDKVKGFADGEDKLVFSGFEFADLNIFKDGKHKVIEYGDDSVTLIQRGNADIDAEDFLFL